MTEPIVERLASIVAALYASSEADARKLIDAAMKVRGLGHAADEVADLLDDMARRLRRTRESIEPVKATGILDDTSVDMSLDELSRDLER